MGFILQTKSLLLSADNHLRPLIWRARTDIVNDAVEAFKAVFDIAVVRNTNVILAGDIYDTSYPDSVMVELLGAMADRLATVGLEIFTICGQHDLSVPPWPATLARKNLHCVDGEVFHPAQGVVAYGVNRRLGVDLEGALNRVPIEVNALVMHQLIAPAVDIKNKADIDLDKLPKVRAILAGDYHTTTILRKESKPLLVYPGSSYFCRRSEDPSKWVMEIDGNFNVSKIQLPTRRIIKLSATKLASVMEALSVIQEVPAGEVWDSKLQPLVIVEAALTGAEIKELEITCNKAGWLSMYVPIDVETELAVGPMIKTENRLIAAIGAVVPEEKTEIRQLLSSLVATPERAGSILQEAGVAAGVPLC